MRLLFLPCTLAQLGVLDRSGRITPTEPPVNVLEEALGRRKELVLVLSDIADAAATATGGGRAMTVRQSFDSSIPRTRCLNLDPYREPKPVTAAGGLVVRRGPLGVEIILIHRRGLWDLPKGKLDPGETIEECAVREVNEELGIQDAAIHRAAGSTIHGYVDKTHYAVKTTHWFLMQTSAERFTPQASEQIEAVEWVEIPEALDRLGFDGLRRFVTAVLPTITEVA